MTTDRIIIRLNIHCQNKILDIDIPVDITCNELVIALNSSYGLNIDVSNISKCSLKCENPTALLKGVHTLREYGLHNGSMIHIL